MKEDEKEFLLLLDKNKVIISKIALIYSKNKKDKEDLFQDICLQLWRSYKSFRKDSKFSTWLYRVALNTAISQVRKKKTLDKRELIGVYYDDFTSKYDENRDILFKAIGQLSKIDKALILLWLEEKKYDEIAEILGISKTNVSVKFVRIKEKLKGIINKIKNERSRI